MDPQSDRDEDAVIPDDDEHVECDVQAARGACQNRNSRSVFRRYPQGDPMARNPGLAVTACVIVVAHKVVEDE